ncbi:MAG: biosynthetic arginine decarboxylase [Planctomycetota bacterium]|nr:biosynthetic arginine decarboxylase [Planctomycetota bacterium]MDA1114236.1 biosynthetic arginine decarboxylase [Planctomycetota bacterium]
MSSLELLQEVWKPSQSSSLYQVEGWSQGYFRVHENGALLVDPTRKNTHGVALEEIVKGLADRGYTTPLVLRFPDILQNRLAHLASAFEVAIKENGYQNSYHAVYPIKVNQQRHLVEQLVEFGQEFRFGLEVGSKPELLAVMPMTANHPERLIICNGFKDDRFIEAVILATKIGRNIVPVVEGFRELERIIFYAEKYGVRPKIGVRVKLASEGVGRWRESSGHRSKFGLFLSEVLQMTRLLKEHDMLDCLQLLHCHMGSQVHNIGLIKNVINEIGHVYVELVRLGAGMQYLDIGGGLGIDYDGSATATESSMNYSLEEYANDVVYRIGKICDNAEVAHPRIVSESGRAMVAQHSVLVFDVLGRNSVDTVAESPGTLEQWGEGKDVPLPLQDLQDAADSLDGDRLVERLHDISQSRDEAMNLFALGYLDLEGRALAEKLYWSTSLRLRELMRASGDHPLELEELENLLRETYFCNFSVFQSVPDAWAIGQLFPVMPIHRLDEEPTARVVLGDVTCDSDGKINRFISEYGPQPALDVHPLKDGEPYFLGVFLVGAYQETLGDLHNLFGDTHVAHIRIDGEGGWLVEEVVPGDTAREVLQYVQYEPDRMEAELRKDCERATVAGAITASESRTLMKFYVDGLNGYTYLEASIDA